MPNIRLVTDSTADLPKWFVDEYKVSVIPLHITFPDGRTFLDGVTVTPQEYNELLRNIGDELPKTSTPTKEDFQKVYRAILEEEPDCQIISIHLSSGLSSTVSVAETAARELSPEIYVFDSKNISFGMGLQLFEAVKVIKEGAGASKVLERLRDVAEHTETMFCLDTLENLYKGGRIGRVTAFFGSVLSIKPIIHVKDGIYEPFEKVRSQKQSIQKMIDHASKLLNGKVPAQVAVIHGDCLEMAEALKEKAEAAFGRALTTFSDTTPVVITHSGLGTLGLTVCYL